VVGLGIIAFAWQLLILGLALLALGPFRGRRLVFWPVIAAVVVFGLVSLATPAVCSESTRTVVTDNQVTESTSRVCDDGTRSWWAAAAPLASAVATASVVLFILRERTAGD
jgi:hypothetical protein